MATHDYIISNASGAAVRADLNNALAAIATNNSSATEPTTTYAYQWWADTGSSPTVMKLRNAANSGWITLFQLDGEWTVVPFENGTAAAPSIYFKDSGTDTGIYSPGTDQVAITTGGTGRLFVTSTGSVGVGTGSPSSLLEVSSATTSYIRSSSTTNSISGVFGAATSSFDVGTTSSHAMNFYTAGLNRATLDTSGRLLVGTPTARANLYNSSGTSPLQIEGTTESASAGLITLNSSTAAASPNLVFAKSAGTSLNSNTVVSADHSVGAIYFSGNDGSEFVTVARIEAFVDGTPGANDMPGRIVLATTADGASSPTERMRIGQLGYLKASNNGTYFGSTSPYHERNNNAADWIAVDRNSNANPYGILFEFDSDPNNTANQFWRCRGGGVTRAEIRSNGGLANYSGNNVNLSDINTKKDINPAAGTWDCIKEWEIVNYRYKDQPDDADLNLGVIAQQVAESCPEVITVFSEAKEAKPAVLDDDGNEIEAAQEAQPERLGVKEQQMYWMAIKALQEAQIRIEQLEAKVAALESA